MTYSLGRSALSFKVEKRVLLIWTKNDLKLLVLDVIRSRFPETIEFIDSTLKEECEKERMTADEVIFYKFESKNLA